VRPARPGRAAAAWLVAVALIGCAGEGTAERDSTPGPGFVEAQERFRRAYASGNAGAALDAALAALDAAPQREEPHVWVSKLYTDLGRDAEAVQFFTRRIERSPDSRLPWFYKGFHEWHLSRLDDALRSFERAAELDPSCAACFYRQGLVLHRQGEFDRALEALRHSERLESSATTAALIGDVLRITGRHEEAERSLVGALATFPRAADLHYGLGQLRLHADDRVAAEQALRRAVELEPGHAAAHEALARLLFQDGREAEARRERAIGDRLGDYERGKRTLGTQLHRAHDPALLVLLAEVELTGGKPREALLLFGRAERESGPSVRGLAGQAEALFRLGQLEPAEARLGRLDGLGGARADLARATGLLVRRQSDAARPVLDAAVAGAPAEREFLRRAADLYGQLGLRQRADELYERAAAAPAVALDADASPLP
jgi:tetratricopeptide (TPR) repeat protein